MPPAASDPELHDLEPSAAAMRREVWAGLAGAPQKVLPCKYFYDERGSALFDRICELEEYYVTRTELWIMERDGAQMAKLLGPGCLLVELGSGSSLKTRILLDHLETPAAYVPVDISKEHLQRSAAELAAAYPGLEVRPVCADFLEPFALPEPTRPARRRVVYFPGSTIGNLTRPQAEAFLARLARQVGPGGALLLGVDLVKERGILERAYDDREGVTAEFNRNLLRRLNRELGADFDLGAFRHRAVWNAAEQRIEMHLVSERPQTVRVDGRAFAFAAGESIRTECSHKYRLEDVAALAAPAGLRPHTVWSDPERLFSVQYLVVDP